VKVSPLWATLVAGLCSTMFLATPAWGQVGNPAARPPAASAPTAAPATGTNVAVIDIAFIFKHHARFNAKMEEIKKGIESYEAEMQGTQREFNQAREALATFTPGSREYKQKEEELARMQSQVQVNVALKRKEFLEEEARVYFTVYKEVEESVALFAQRWRIGLVLRYNREEMKPDSRESVLQGVNRAVVYHGGLDITDQILSELNRGAIPPATSGQGQPAPQIPPTARQPVIPGQPGQRQF
jgi:Skp family chaperone for outer membrane proteins